MSIREVPPSFLNRLAEWSLIIKTHMGNLVNALNSVICSHSDINTL